MKKIKNETSLGIQKKSEIYNSAVSFTVLFAYFIVFILNTEILVFSNPLTFILPVFLSAFLVYIVMSLGVEIVLSIRQFDLSVSSVAVLVAIVYTYFVNLGWGVGAFLVSMTVGLLCGLVTGLISLFFKSESGLFASMFMLVFAREFSFLISKGQVLTIYSMTSGQESYMLYRFIFPILIALFFIFIYYHFFVQKRWIYYLRSFGMDDKAFVRFSISSYKIYILTFLFSAFSASCVGIILAMVDGVVDAQNTAIGIFIDVLFIALISSYFNVYEGSGLFQVVLLSLFISLFQSLFSIYALPKFYLILTKSLIVFLMFIVLNLKNKDRMRWK